MKFVSWNVNGLRAVARKGFAEIFADFDADFFCLQETKLQAGQIDLEFPGYKSYWDYAEKKGYSGTVIYTRKEPLSVAYGLGIPEHDTEGRAVTLEFPDFYLVNTYVPNSGEGLKRLDYRMTWDDAFREYVRGLAGKKSVIICGDLNVAHHEIDLKNPETNRLNAGFTDEERENMTALLAAGFTDTWRFQHPEEVKYSWWSYRMMARDRNIGWRIDYFLVSNDLISRIGSTDIHNEVFGSDHCPVELVINGK
ncbi:MAG: exodeoxyribonuclease III [Rikenellaceae bacterium]|nr:exodeoxyribonuclease III [Rikenellaceae bacterium]